MRILLPFLLLLMPNIFLIYSFGEEQEPVLIVENGSMQQTNQTENGGVAYEKSELDKLFEAMRKNEERQWRQGDVLIASATILALFGFASFLTIQFRGRNSDRKDFLEYVDIVLISIFIIQFLQLVIISLIVSGFFHLITYIVIIVWIILCLFSILLSSRKIVNLQNSGDVKIEQGDELIQTVKQKFSHMMTAKAQDAIKKADQIKKMMDKEEKN